MIALIDYGMGNLYSVTKALERLGTRVELADTGEKIRQAERAILPGVGAFGDAMRELRQRSLIEPIREFVARKKPFLGVCLGLQLLFDWSTEGGRHEGLGLLPGHVANFSETSTSSKKGKLKVPHMGWNQVGLRNSNLGLFRNIGNHEYFYFVHSYFVVPADEEIIVGTTEYGSAFASVIAKENVYACQFHPEKSHDAGRTLLKNFLELS